MVFAPVLLEDGAYELLADHRGEEYFFAGLDRADGERKEYLLNASGGLDSGGVRFQVGPDEVLRAGTYLLWAKGEGAWDMELNRVTN